MSRTERMTRIGYQIATGRIADYAFRAALTRLIALAAMTAAAVLGAARWPSFVIIAFAAVGSALSLSDSYHVERGLVPRIPVIRALFQYTVEGHGQFRVNASGVIEALLYAPLVFIGPWLMASSPVQARLVCLAAALVFVASCVSIVFVDPAFYNPDVTFPRWIEAVRSTAGVISAALAAVAVLTAPWDGFAWWIAAGVCAALITIQLRIRETDRIIAFARRAGENEQIVGRQAITRHLHSMVGTPLESMNPVMVRYRRQDPELFDAYRGVVGGYRELLGMDEAADLDVDWPGLLTSHLRALGGRYGTLYRFTHPQQPLTRPDRLLAHLVLDDLATNAAKVGATECDVALRLTEGGVFEATAVDNGAAINPNTWMRTGGGLQRLDVRLRDRGGGITHRTNLDGTKIITARWQSTPDTEDPQP